MQTQAQLAGMISAWRFSRLSAMGLANAAPTPAPLSQPLSARSPYPAQSRTPVSRSMFSFGLGLHPFHLQQSQPAGQWERRRVHSPSPRPRAGSIKHEGRLLATQLPFAPTPTFAGHMTGRLLGSGKQLACFVSDAFRGGPIASKVGSNAAQLVLSGQAAQEG